MCPLTDEWIHNLWSIHAMEYYSPLKRKDILTPSTAWMDLTLYDSTYLKYLEPHSWSQGRVEWWLPGEGGGGGSGSCYRVSVLQNETSSGDCLQK